MNAKRLCGDDAFTIAWDDVERLPSPCSHLVTLTNPQCRCQVCPSCRLCPAQLGRPLSWGWLVAPDNSLGHDVVNEALGTAIGRVSRIQHPIFGFFG
jgi:hypothetical protein